MIKSGNLPETHGLELEAVIVDQRGEPLLLTERHWQGLLHLTGGSPHYSVLDGVEYLIGVDTDIFHYSLDASRALVEIGYAPQHNLNQLAHLVQESLREFHQSLWEMAGEEEAALLALAMHPLAKRTMEVYRQVVTPKKLYTIFWEWNWDHTAGLFSASLQPWTSIDVYRAADALAVMQGFSGLLLALFGNSPLVEGQWTGCKENRELIWQRMLGNSNRLSDRQLVCMIPKRPTTLAQYFQWLYKDKAMFIVLEQGDYKTAQMFVVPEFPPLLEYLQRDTWYAYKLGNQQHRITLIPDVKHLFTHQWSYFGPARWRYQIREEASLPKAEFLQAIEHDQEPILEELLAPHLVMSCIETRCIGTILPYAGAPFTHEMMAGNALQTGLLRNLDQALELIDSYPWSFWQKLRRAAIREGLQARVEQIPLLPLARQMVQIAWQGLQPAEQWLLTPLQSILEQERSNADMIIALYAEELKKGKNAEEACRCIIERRKYTKM